MKFIVAALILAFTVEFASPSFAFDLLDAIEEKADELLPDTEVLEERANEVMEQAAAKVEAVEAEAEAKAQALVKLEAEFENMMGENRSRVYEALILPLDTENHCEVAKAVRAMQASVMFFTVKQINLGEFSYSEQDSLKDTFKEGIQKIRGFATLKMAVCDNFYLFRSKISVVTPVPLGCTSTAV